MHYLVDSVGPEGKVAFHLSNLMGTRLDQFARAFSVARAREFHRLLNRPSDEFECALQQTKSQTICAWAPMENGQVQRVAAVMKDLVYREPAHYSMMLAIPFDPFPDCTRAAHTTDV